MAAYYEETLEDRYSRENQEHLSVLARMKPEQIQHMEISLNNALSDVDMLRKNVRGLAEALEAMLAVRVIEADVNYGLACAKAEHALAAHRKNGGGQ